MACLNCLKHFPLGLDGLSMFGKKKTTVRKRAGRARSDESDSDSGSEINLESWVVEPPLELDNPAMNDEEEVEEEEEEEKISIATSRDSGHFEAEQVPETSSTAAAASDIMPDTSEPEPRPRSETISTSSPSTEIAQNPPEPEIVGDLELKIGYKEKKKRLTVAVIKATNLPAKEHGGALGVRIQLALLPDKLQRGKTRIRLGQDALFNEVFRFTNLTPAMLQTYAMRFRLFGKDKSRQEPRIIGEKILNLSTVKREETLQPVCIKLNAKSLISEPVHPSRRSFLKRRAGSLEGGNSSLKINKDPRRARKLSKETAVAAGQVANLVGNNFGKGMM